MWYFLWFIIKLQKHVNCLYSMMLGSGPNLGNKFSTTNFLLLTIFGSLVLNLSGILSTWTFELPPTYLTWTIVDIWPTTHPPNLVHVVFEWPHVLISLHRQKSFSNKNFLSTDAYQNIKNVEASSLRGFKNGKVNLCST